METASISAISSDLSVSVSFVIANELVEAAREDGMRNDELAAVLVAVVVLITAAKSMVGRWQASSLTNGAARVKALATQRATSLGVDDVDAFVKSAVEEAGSRKGLLAFVSELLSIATRISLSVTIQVLAVSVSATGSSRLLRVGAGNDGANLSTALVLGDDGSGDGPTFTGISLKDLEFRLRNNKDGAESSLCTDDESVASRKRRRAPTGGAPASRGKAVSRRKSASGGAEDELGAAVFGNHDEDFGEDFEGDDDEDEDDLGASESASQAEGGGSAPIRGERCPGCILDRDTVGQVEKFVRENAMMMSETPLFKAAALFYEQKVLAAHRREGVRCCKWPWKSIREHFSLHVVDPVLARISVIRTLGNIRSFSESNLVRVEGDGSKQLDPKQIELLLKVSAMQSKELTLLDACRMPPPPPRARGGSGSNSSN